MCPFEPATKRRTSITRGAQGSSCLCCSSRRRCGACALLAATRPETAPVVPPSAVPCARSSLRFGAHCGCGAPCLGFTKCGFFLLLLFFLWQRHRAATALRASLVGATETSTRLLCFLSPTNRGLVRRGAPNGSRFFFVLFFYGLTGNCSASFGGARCVVARFLPVSLCSGWHRMMARLRGDGERRPLWLLDRELIAAPRQPAQSRHHPMPSRTKRNEACRVGRVRGFLFFVLFNLIGN